MNNFKIVSINTSDKVNAVKAPVNSANVIEDYGIDGDAHAGTKLRQISLLAEEDMDLIRKSIPEISYGSFAENITTRDVDLSSLPVGKHLQLDNVVLEITQIGKKCHTGCAISEQAGTCIMPKKGVFTKVIKGGKINLESNCTY